MGLTDMSMRDFLGLDGTRSSKVSLIVHILVIIVFICWALAVKDIFIVGYKDGIVHCFSTEDYVKMTDAGRAMYGDSEYWDIRTGNITDMLDFLEDIEKIKRYNFEDRKIDYLHQPTLP